MVTFPDFNRRCDSIASQRYNPSLAGERQFVRQLFEAFMESKLSDQQLREWLKGRLSEHFRFLDVLPEWVREPMWPYHEGKPMVFVTQYAVPESGYILAGGRWPVAGVGKTRHLPEP